MKNILITSNQNHSDLFHFLKQIDTDLLVTMNKDVIEIQKNNDNCDDIYTVLAIYILNLLHNKLTTKISLYFNDDLDLEIMENLYNSQRYKPYIEPLKILLNQHFKNNNLLNLSSFITFNCRGLEKEVHKFGQDYIAIYIAENENRKNTIQKPMNNSKKNIINFIDSSVTYQDYLKRLNELFLELNTEIEFLEEAIYLENVHVKELDGVISLVDENNKNIERTLDQHTNFPILEEINDTNETLRLTIILLACITILKTKTIVFHKSADDNIVSQILVYLSDSKNFNPNIDTVNLFKCNSCDFCY